MPSLDIIIVNWNSGSYLYNCINSVFNAKVDGFLLGEIMVVDNASDDNSIELINNLELPIKVIKNSENLGFAKACNQGAFGSSADYVLMLNPDTRLFRDSLSIPIEFLEKKENKNIGICGIQLINENNEIARNCARFPTPLSMISRSLGLDKIIPGIVKGHFMTNWDHNDSRFVDQVMGAFFLIRKELFERLGGYDERFFVYYEDLDFSLRASKIGFRSYYLHSAKVYHKGGGTSEQVKADRLFYNIRSKAFFAKKHFKAFSYLTVFISILFFEPISRSIYSILKGSLRSVGEIVIAYKRLISIIVMNRNDIT
ncbi:MAG: glycosyltransferase family 2 protein [Ignavibacteria bacterium]|jgi:GT2 family glycosyltransferase